MTVDGENFFDEIADLLERTATFASSWFIVGDLNLHLDMTTDVHSVRLNQLLSVHDLVQHVKGPCTAMVTSWTCSSAVRMMLCDLFELIHHCCLTTHV